MEAHHGFLTSSERHALRAMLHRTDHSAQEHGRVNAILLIDDGVPIPLIAKLLFLDEQSVRNFLERYRPGKIDTLLGNHYRGRESRLTGEEKDRLRQHVAENLYIDCALVIAYIQFEFGKAYSKNGAHRLLHELGFVYKKPSTSPARRMLRDRPNSRPAFKSSWHGKPPWPECISWMPPSAVQF